MKGIDLPRAIKYNTKRSKTLWSQDELPWPLSAKNQLGYFIPADSRGFAWAIASFQKLHGLQADGRLGPATIAVMRARTIPEEPSSAGSEFERDWPEMEVPRPRPLSTEPARKGASNRLIIDGESVKLPESMLELGITASNYRDDNDIRFDQFEKRSRVTSLVIHESVTMSSAQSNRLLMERREKSAALGHNDGKGWDYGVHLNLAPDGHITCHADLVTHRLVHAKQLNDTSIGLMVVNPYNPAFAAPPYDEVVIGDWWCWRPRNRHRLYTLPTQQQMRAVVPLLKFLTETIESLPLEFPTADLDKDNTRIDGWKDGAKPEPGIVAYRDFSAFASGRYILEHCIKENTKPLHERI